MIPKLAALKELYPAQKLMPAIASQVLAHDRTRLKYKTPDAVHRASGLNRGKHISGQHIYHREAVSFLERHTWKAKRLDVALRYYVPLRQSGSLAPLLLYARPVPKISLGDQPDSLSLHVPQV